VIRRSPLDGVPMVEGLRELRFVPQFGVRVAPAQADAVAPVIGFDLPLEPNLVGGDDQLAALWLGPDEWLVVGPANETELSDALAPVGGSVVDVSANRTTLELRGPRVRELLEFGCPIDLHPRVFGPGRCAQTLLARANVLIWHVADAPEDTWRMLVRPSFAAYVAMWLADAADGLSE
jgi:sarcosine oxidase, subunit gamma